MPLRTIVVDDSIIFRKAVRDSLSTCDDVQVIDVASDGTSAIQKIIAQKPDLVTLDVEMPGVDGLGVLEAIRTAKLDTNVIMLSSHTGRGAATTTRALALGAFDFILKPTHSTFEQNVSELRNQLATRVSILARKPNQPSKRVPTPVRVTERTSTTEGLPARNTISDRIEAVLIGVSTGGPKALRTLIPSLPANLSAPILIVQHMPPLFTASLADDLNRCSALNVFEATDGMPLKGGEVYIAPGGKQMRVGGFPGGWRAEVTDDPAVKSCKPSVDYLFESAARAFGKRCLAIVMTGMGDDGTTGCTHIRKRGGCVWAQDEASCTVYGMPRRVIECGLADEIYPLHDIGTELCRHLRSASAVVA